MEQQSSVKRSQKSRKTAAPVKVVYISNPMKIKASPSEFRAVVQQLTGRYATYPPSHEYELPGIIVNKDTHHQHNYCGQRCAPAADALRCPYRSDLSYESGRRPEDDHEQVIDDFIITPQMLDGYSPLMPSDFES